MVQTVLYNIPVKLHIYACKIQIYKNIYIFMYVKKICIVAHTFFMKEAKSHSANMVVTIFPLTKQ